MRTYYITYYILKKKNWNIDLYKKDKILPFAWVESDKSFSEDYEIAKQLESFADTINLVRKLNEDFIKSNNSMCFENEDTSTTKDEKYIESLEKQNEDMKNIISEYYDLVEEMLMFKKRNTEKAVKIMVKAEKIIKE